MSITFGGLASGIDTELIVTELMNIERAPIDRLENDKTYYTNRLKAFSTLNDKLNAFQTKAEAIDSALELNSPSVQAGSDEYFSASASGSAQLGSYQISVVDLAQQQKDVSQGYADKTADVFAAGNISLTVGGVANSITIDSDSTSLEGVAQAINDADLGVSATIINDGTGTTPYRLVLTGDSVADTFSLDASAIAGSGAAPVLANTQAAQQAHVVIDGIDVYSDSNNLDSAVSGLSIELLKADPATTTTLNISTDKAATEAKIKEFADAYNGIINFFADQKDAGWGNDSSFRSIKGRLQQLLVSSQASGTFTNLSQLGFETQRDGTVVLNSTRLNDALTEDYQAVIELFAGDGTNDGISAQFSSYLDDMTDSADGIYAARKETTDSTLRRIDTRINSLELRMEQREKTLRSQFSAMENLVSGLNAQGTYLLQQLSTLTLGG